MSLIDQIRDVPETAVRIYLGAKVTPVDGLYRIELDGRTYDVSKSVLEEASAIARALAVNPREIQFATDVLELRHHAEDLFLEGIANVSDLPKILFVPAGGLMASAFYRARIPADMMDSNGLAVSHFTDRLDLSKALRYQILWIQLGASPALYRIAERAKAEGIKIVYDVDDRFDAVPEGNVAAELYVEQKVADVWKMIALADVVTVSTRNLAAYVREKAGDKVRVLPNMIMASIATKRAIPPREFTRILWAGSNTHQRDLAVAAPGLRAVLERGAGKVRFTLFGEQLPELLEPVRQYVDLMKFVPFVEYQEALAEVGAHFAIAPLKNDEFNAAKSAVKFYEYSACGYATLLSDVGEYADLPPEAVRFISDDDLWEKNLTRAIESPDFVQEYGERAKAWVHMNRCVMRAKGKPWLEVAHELLGSPARA